MDKKYDFSLSFDEEEIKQDIEAEAAQAAEERRRAAEEARVQSAREEGYKNGHQEGHAAGKQEGITEKNREIESLATQTQKSITAQLTDIATRQEKILNDHMHSSLAAAMITLKALFPGFVRKHGVAEVEALILQCLERVLDEPRVLIRVHPEVASLLSERMGAIAERVGYGGKVRVIDRDDMALDECKIEWKDGLAERNSARTWQDVEEILARYIEPGAIEPETVEPETVEPEAVENQNMDDSGDFHDASTDGPKGEAQEDHTAEKAPLQEPQIQEPQI